jgi:hypothetical protein
VSTVMNLLISIKWGNLLDRLRICYLFKKNVPQEGCVEYGTVILLFARSKHCTQASPLRLHYKIFQIAGNVL